jgi:hypothetical protein
MAILYGQLQAGAKFIYAKIQQLPEPELLPADHWFKHFNV